MVKKKYQIDIFFIVDINNDKILCFNHRELKLELIRFVFSLPITKSTIESNQT